MNEWMKKWKSNDWLNEKRISGWIISLMNRWMNAWMHIWHINKWWVKWKNEKINESMNEWMFEHSFINERVKDWINVWMNGWMNWWWPGNRHDLHEVYLRYDELIWDPWMNDEWVNAWLTCDLLTNWRSWCELDTLLPYCCT